MNDFAKMMPERRNLPQKHSLFAGVFVIIIMLRNMLRNNYNS